MLTPMKSALGLVLGVTILATAVGCDNAGDNTGTGPQIVGGSGGAGSVLPGGASSGGTGTLAEGVPLTPLNGWVAVDNVLKIQGAMFPFGDKYSMMTVMPMDFSMSGDKACIAGTAAKVDMASMPCTTKMFTAPATDCYGEYWGVAIGMNMNQTIDEATGMGSTPGPYDASAIKGFAFNISGAAVPTSLRFKVENAAGEYCSPPAKKIAAGPNTFMFGDVVKECWKTPTPTAPTGETAKADLLKISWQVVTNAMGAVPFDFCVSDVRALQ